MPLRSRAHPEKSEAVFGEKYTQKQIDREFSVSQSEQEML